MFKAKVTMAELIKFYFDQKKIKKKIDQISLCKRHVEVTIQILKSDKNFLNKFYKIN